MMLDHILHSTFYYIASGINAWLGKATWDILRHSSETGVYICFSTFRDKTMPLHI